MIPNLTKKTQENPKVTEVVLPSGAVVSIVEDTDTLESRISKQITKKSADFIGEGVSTDLAIHFIDFLNIPVDHYTKIERLGVPKSLTATILIPELEDQKVVFKYVPFSRIFFYNNHIKVKEGEEAKRSVLLHECLDHMSFNLDTLLAIQKGNNNVVGFRDYPHLRYAFALINRFKWGIELDHLAFVHRQDMEKEAKSVLSK